MRRTTSDRSSRSVTLVLLARRPGRRPRRRPDVIKLGNLVDLTGPTSDQGKDIAQGRNDAVQYFNEKGGVNGKKLELVSVEYGFQPPRAVAAYKKFVEDDKVLLVLGYGTPDTEALRPFITKDKVPYISGLVLRAPDRSQADALQLPRRHRLHEPDPHLPQLREGDAGRTRAASRGWPSSSPTTRYGRAPIEAGRAYAKEIGVDLVDEEIIPTILTDATSQLLTMKQKDPDFAYINTNTQWVPVVLKDSYKLGLQDEVRRQQLRHRRADARSWPARRPRA